MWEVEERLAAAAKKFTRGERGAKGEMRLLKTRDLSALRQKTTSSATQSL